jgi:low affinity Fe/Cu permease
MAEVSRNNPGGAPRGRVLTPEEWEAQKLAQDFRSVIPPGTEEASLKGLILRPKKVSFATQNKGEQVFMLLRRHWYTNIGWVVNSMLTATIPFFIYIISALLGFNLVVIMGWKLAVTVVIMFYSFLITNVVRSLSEWYFNLYLVTSQRVLDYDFRPFHSSGVSETALVSIQDVKQESVGFLPSIFNYGDVSIFTAADRNVIIFHKVPNPTLVRDKILDLAEVAGRTRRPHGSI